ncbi:programmed cell death protein 2-like [Cyprinodon tularosa]|uniref:programmed cell death protein 2-like n=1 Tax=Cyprinodon tularosa TaxID=77115 RepID=UPI0018E1F587|nr:programmed cell death protein 2-like [Cyprinodon tularosa]
MAEDQLLIGVSDGELDPRRFRSSVLTNKVGGQPDWPPVLAPRSPTCGCCGSPLALVVQVYCPLQGSSFHRILHLFGCCRPGCSGQQAGWTALRSQWVEAPCQPPPPQGALPSATDWCESADDWGMEEGGGAEELQDGGLRTEVGRPVSQMDVSSGLERLSLVEPKDVPVYRPLFISVLEESELGGEDDELEHAQQLLREYERREGVAVRGSDEGGGEEKYEKTKARHGDHVFSRFMKTISTCPQQILRYQRHGTPLFISKPPPSLSRLIPACGSCGEPRVFELQLMPALVSLLQRTDGGAEDQLEFGTVLIYSCRASCWTVGSESPVEEFCWVQSDPDQHLFK